MSESLPTRNVTLRSILKSQYHASLAMLRSTIERCPPGVWVAAGHANAFWQVAYHTLYFGHLYLQLNEAAFQPWERHQGGVQHPDGLTGPADPASTLPVMPRPYSQADVLAYWGICDRMVDAAVEAMDLDATESGFPWYGVSRLEHQLINIRHIQHHTAQLADRLRDAADIGTRWVGSAPLPIGE